MAREGIRALHQRAYNARAGLIGELASCMCTYPLEQFDSETKHDPESCPAHAMIAARLSERELAGALAAVRARVSP